MKNTDIFKFINENPVGQLATTVDNIPYVRNVLIYSANNDGIVFHTGSFKELFKQLSANPKVEFCFTNHDLENPIQIRVGGNVHLCSSSELKQEIIDKRIFLRPMVKKLGIDSLAVYTLKDGIANVWTKDVNFDDKVFINL